MLAAVLLGVAVASACSVDGTSHPDLSARLVGADAFPSGSTPTVVNGPALRSLLADVSGNPGSGTIDPPACTPRELSADDSAAITALEPTGSTMGTLTVVVTRVSDPLASVTKSLADCASWTRTNAAGASSKVRRGAISPQPKSPISSVATVGIATVETTGGTGASAVGVVSKTYLAQRDDVRVYAVHRGTATVYAVNAEPSAVGATSTPDLDTLFAAAVRRAFGR